MLRTCFRSCSTAGVAAAALAAACGSLLASEHRTALASGTSAQYSPSDYEEAVKEAVELFRPQEVG